jgi:hypothetical protein
MLKRVSVIVVVVIALACGGSSNSTPTTPTPTQANITVTLSPTPATSTDCSPTCQGLDGRVFRWRVQGTLTIQETAGIGGSVNSITVTAFNPQIVYTSDTIIQRSGTNRVAARGMLIFPVNIIYGLVDNPSASRQLVMPFVVDFADDRGNHLTGIAQWSVN